MNTVHWVKSLLPSPGNVPFTLVMMGVMLWFQPANAFPQTESGIQQYVPAIVPYQGRLADAQGNPVTTTVAMTFRLYNSTGTAVWVEQQPAVRVERGLFNVLLGEITPISQSVLDSNPA